MLSWWCSTNGFTADLPQSDVETSIVRGPPFCALPVVNPGISRGGAPCLVQQIPSPAIMPATLTVVCNIPFVPLITGQDEGFSLDAPFGSFKPQMPTVGITIFGTANE